jgi:hypothetical protein
MRRDSGLCVFAPPSKAGEIFGLWGELQRSGNTADLLRLLHRHARSPCVDEALRRALVFRAPCDAQVDAFHRKLFARSVGSLPCTATMLTSHGRESRTSSVSFAPTVSPSLSARAPKVSRMKRLGEQVAADLQGDALRSVHQVPVVRFERERNGGQRGGDVDVARVHTCTHVVEKAHPLGH